MLYSPSVDQHDLSTTEDRNEVWVLSTCPEQHLLGEQSTKSWSSFILWCEGFKEGKSVSALSTDRYKETLEVEEMSWVPSLLERLVSTVINSHQWWCRPDKHCYKARASAVICLPRSLYVLSLLPRPSFKQLCCSLRDWEQQDGSIPHHMIC